MIGQETQPLTQLEFQPEDHDQAQQMAERLGYRQTAYTSTSDLWGLYCLPEPHEHIKNGADLRYAEQGRWKYPPYRPGCIIKTKELGLLFVQDREDLGLGNG